MKKTKTIEYTICDFPHQEETNAVGKVMPSGKDACETHYKAYMKEVRLPEDLGGDMPGLRVSVDPGYTAKMVVEYKKDK